MSILCRFPESDFGPVHVYPFQARSQVILRGGAIQKGDGPNEAGGASL